MCSSSRKITRFLLELGATMVLAGLVTLMVMFCLAWLVPLPEDSFARNLRSGFGLAISIVIGLRVSRWLERRWGGGG